MSFPHESTRKEAQLLVIPSQSGAGFPYYEEIWRSGRHQIDGILFETFPGGNICSQAPFAAVPFLRDVANFSQVPLFIYPTGTQLPSGKMRSDGAISLITNNQPRTAILETGFGALTNRIAADVRQLFLQGKNPEKIAGDMRAMYRYEEGQAAQWTELIGEYQRKMFEYMGTESFGMAHFKLTLALAGIVGKRIGIDLEGVLVNKRSTYDERLRTRDLRVKRVLADELLHGLAVDNQVVICTNLPREYAQYVIEATDINLPEHAGLLTREDINRARESSGNSALNMGVKSPSLLHLDFLLDDNADFHAHNVQDAGINPDKERFIPVDRFQLENACDFNTHYHDLGLLKAAEALESANRKQ